jgi:predicted nucleic acid-binding protein
MGLSAMIKLTAKRAATLRAVYDLRTPDALQIATALEFNCQAVLTNDKQLQRVTELRVLILDELEL